MLVVVFRRSLRGIKDAEHWNSLARNYVRLIINWSRDFLFLFFFVALLDWHRDSSRIHDNLEHFITYPQWISPARHKRSHEGSKVMLTESSVVLRMRICLFVVHQRFIVLYIFKLHICLKMACESNILIF